MAISRRHRPISVAAADALPSRSGVTADRCVRLLRLLGLLAEKALSRDALARRLGLDVRGFYRDLGLLRAAGIVVALENGRYRLDGKAAKAIELLPFPDPLLTLGEARSLAKGKTVAHRKLRELLAHLSA